MHPVHRLTATFSLVSLAACSLGVRLPEGRITCSADADCPPDWVCRLPADDTAGLCYRTAADLDASADPDGAAPPPETGDADTPSDAASSEAGDASKPSDAGPAVDGSAENDAALGTDAAVGAAPSVSAVTLTRTVFRSGESVQVSCLASDPDGDTLGYAWSSGSGSFGSPDQRSTLYTTGPVGPASLTCAVDDGHGNAAQASASLRVYPSGLVTYLPFSISAGGNDASGQGRAGDVTNGMYVADRAGNPAAALELSSGGSVTLADPAAFAVASWSFVATLRPSAGGGTVMGKAGASGFGTYGLFLYPENDPSLPGRIQYYQQAGNAGAPYVFAPTTYTARAGVFFQLAVTRSEAGELRIYVDGTQVGVQSNLPAPVPNDGPLVLGSGSFGSYVGVIDEVQFYARVLDAAEVAKLAEMQ